jgi:hypothetical protein
VREGYLGGISQIVKFDGHNRFFRAGIAVPSPRENNFFGRRDFPIRAEDAVHVPAFVVYFDTITSSDAEFEFRDDGGIFLGRREPLGQLSAIGPGAENPVPWRTKRSFRLEG